MFETESLFARKKGEWYHIDANGDVRKEVPSKALQQAAPLEGDCLIGSSSFGATLYEDTAAQRLREIGPRFCAAQTQVVSLQDALKREYEARKRAENAVERIANVEGRDFEFGLAVGGVIFGVLGVIIGAYLAMPSREEPEALMPTDISPDNVFYVILKGATEAQRPVAT